MKQSIIINADDYGRSVSINEAIRSSFEQRIISDTSIMVTCREGLEDLYESRNLECLHGAAGCHLTLTLGSPVTSIKSNLPFIDENGLFSRPLKSPFLRDIVQVQYLAYFLKHAQKSVHSSFEVICCCREKYVHSISYHTLIKVAAQTIIRL